MDNELLSILTDIRTAIYWLLAVVIVGVIANWIRAGISIKNAMGKKLDDLFTDEASELYDKGQFGDLISHCEEYLNSRPNHSYALWYKAKALYQKQEYKKSKECFEQLSKNEPSWDESNIQPYLKKIEVIESNER